MNKPRTLNIKIWQFKYNIQHSNAIKGQSRNNYTIFGRIKATHIIGAFKLARDTIFKEIIYTKMKSVIFCVMK